MQFKLSLDGCKGGHMTVGCAMLANSATVAIGNETAGSGTPCASQHLAHTWGGK